MSLQKKMLSEMRDKAIFEQAKGYAYEYADGIEEMDVFPHQERLDDLENLGGALPKTSGDSSEILKLLHQYGSPATIAQTGGRYFGFVDGGALPISIATKWLSDFRVYSFCSTCAPGITCARRQEPLPSCEVEG